MVIYAQNTNLALTLNIMLKMLAPPRPGRKSTEAQQNCNGTVSKKNTGGSKIPEITMHIIIGICTVQSCDEVIKRQATKLLDLMPWNLYIKI